MLAFGSAADKIGGNGFDGLFRNREPGGLVIFSGPYAKLSIFKKDIIQANCTDLTGAQSQGVCQMNHGIGSEVACRREFQAGKQPFQLMGSQKIRRFGFGELGRTDDKRGQVGL